ncbi:MAG: DUF3857 domain-containing protein [Flavobacteriales bacterium]|nr:DUF3857 domain-containing protein [Flavobacteriales bacterium]
MKKLVSSTLFVLFVSLALGQDKDLFYKDYTWDQEPKFKTVAIDEDEHEVIIKDKRAIEFAYDDGGFYEYYLKHKIVYIGTERAIEDNNRVYIPSDRIIESIFHKARVVSKDGKITELDEDDIKEAKDEESDDSYKYFALEGVEIGSFVEYLYLVKKSASYKGKIEFFQGEERRRDVSFDLISPYNLIFKTKSYNNLAEVETDTTLEDKNRFYFKMAEMPRLKDEESAGNISNWAAIIYKLERNTATGGKDISSYGDVSSTLYSSLYGELGKKTIKALKKLIAESGANDVTSTDEKIRKVENHVKANIGFYDASAAQLSTIDNVLTNKLANDFGFTTLFCNLYKLMDIKVQFVLTSTRDFIKFDPEFEGYNFLQQYLLYFPSEGKYMDPSGTALRFGYISPEYTHTYGLFVKEITIGGLTTAVGKVKFIEALTYDQSTSNLYIQVDLTESVTEPSIHVDNAMTGYYASGIQTVYELIPEESQEEIRKSYMEYISGKENLDNLVVKNATAEDFGLKPFIVSADFTTTNFTEKAGPKVLFKAGELIGQQAEMYDEDERKQDVESDFNRKYYRELTIKLPDNYMLTNPDVMNSEVLYKDGDKITAAFTSEYTITDNIMKVIVEEYYTTINYPKERIEDYKAVINAAADFNKKVMIFEKK